MCIHAWLVQTKAIAFQNNPGIVWAHMHRMSLSASSENTAWRLGKTGISSNMSGFFAAGCEQQVHSSAAREPPNLSSSALRAMGAKHWCKVGRLLCIKISLWEIPRTSPGRGENPWQWCGLVLQVFVSLWLWTQAVGCITKQPSKVKGWGIPGWRSGLAPAFGSGRDPGDPGSSPMSGSQCMEPASPSASLSLCAYHK